ncbi:MAG: AMP-binding protein [Pseudomonadota bacterium]
MHLTDLSRYDEAQTHFSKDGLWELFDGTRDRLNMAHECLDRHRDKGLTIRVANADGSNETHTLESVADSANQIANWLRARGVRQGERVALMLEPSAAFYATLFGVMKAGGVAVPMFTLFGPEALRLRVVDCTPSLMVTTDEKLSITRDAGVPEVLSADELLEYAAAYETTCEATTRADDLALFQYTSGTTRELPEAVQHRHRAVVTVAVAALYATGVRPGEAFMCPSSPAWGHGLAHGTLGPLGLGASIASYAGEFKAERLLAAISEFGIENLSAAATHYRMMRQVGAAAHFPNRLRKLSFTGEPLDAPTAAWAAETFGHEICSIYGSTEVGVVLADYPGAGDHKVRRGALGKPVPGLEVQVLSPSGGVCAPGEIGEISVRRRDGWFGIKDRGHTDEDGYFYHDGRADDVIITAGWTVSAREVEDALLAHAAVAEAAVIGVPDELRGQVIKAYVVALDAAPEPTTEALQQFVKQHSSAHAYPRIVEFVSALPKTPAGKINRRVLREQADAARQQVEQRE